MRRVVITGLGPITAIGVGKKAFWEGMTSGKSGIGPVTRFDPSLFNARSAAEINDWEPEYFFSSQRLQRLDRYCWFAVGSAERALEDSGLSFSPEHAHARVGVRFGAALAGVSNAENQLVSF